MTPQTGRNQFIDYVSFQVPDECFSDIINCICIVRGFMHDSHCLKKGCSTLEAVLLHVPVDYQCVDLSLYKVTRKLEVFHHTAFMVSILLFTSLNIYPFIF